MKKLIPIFLFVALFSCTGQNRVGNKTFTNTRQDRIEVGIIDSVYSNVLKEYRKIWVYVPNTFNNPMFRSHKNFPVAYLLDGDVHFHSFTGMLDQLSEQGGNMICPDMIVVGVLNTNRTRDFTPSQDDAVDEQSGGSERFNAFMEQELIPYIDSVYKPAPFRLLIGHSYGGLYVVNTLLHHAHAYNAFIALDPSLSWNNSQELVAADSCLSRSRYDNKYFYLAIANTMTADMPLDVVKKDTSRDSRHIRAILSFLDLLQKKPDSLLHWTYDYYEDEDHHSVPLRGEYDALHFIFRYYPFSAYGQLFDSTITTDSAMRIVQSHFQYESAQLGYSVQPSERFINDVAYEFLDAGMLQKAFSFFRMNLNNYPESANVYDSMGDYYLASCDSASAVTYFKKSIANGGTEETKDKLNGLQRSGR